jgi:hypothetical protein
MTRLTLAIILWAGALLQPVHSQTIQSPPAPGQSVLEQPSSEAPAAEPSAAAATPTRPVNASPPLTAMPLAKGLPLIVRASVAFIELTGFDENAGRFKGVVDLRLRWEDPRLRRPAAELNQPPAVFRSAAALAERTRLWTPPVEIVNLASEPRPSVETGLRLFPDGQIELQQRIKGDFATPQTADRFPFDRQKLQVKLAIKDASTETLRISFDQDDLDYSRPLAELALDGWTLRFVDLKTESRAGWYGASHATLSAALDIARDPGPAVATIYIPLFASLIIPMLALWLNRIEDGVFQVDTFELVNIVIGGLFAVIALNFTVNSVFQALATSDNSVNRLFALNYLALGISLLINVAICRFSLVARAFGVHVQYEVYRVLLWAVPTLVFTLALSFILLAIV